MSPIKIARGGFLFLVFLLLGFPLFYFVYKYGDPEPLAHDFFQYYWLYKDYRIDHVIAPHNMRLVGAFFVNIFYQLNFFYDTDVLFDKYQSWGFLKQVYFNAILFNYLTVVATCLVIYKILKKHVDAFLSFIGGLCYLLGFGTIFYALMPLTDAFSILLFALTIYFYQDKKYAIVFPLVLLILQREYIFLALGLLASLDFFKSRSGYYLNVLIVSFVCFSVYYVLRKTVFYTAHLDFQSQPGNMLDSLLHTTVAWGRYVKQMVLTLNLFFIYLVLVGYKSLMKLNVDRFALLKIVLLFLQVNLVSIAGGHDNNAGRYFYLIVPVVIIQLVKEVDCLLKPRKLGARNKEKISIDTVKDSLIIT